MGHTRCRVILNTEKEGSMKKGSLLVTTLASALIVVACSQKAPEPGQATVQMPAKYDINNTQTTSGHSQTKAYKKKYRKTAKKKPNQSSDQYRSPYSTH